MFKSLFLYHQIFSFFISRNFVCDYKESNDTRILDEINNSKLSQEIRIKLGANYDSRPFLVSSSPSTSTPSAGTSYQCSFIPSLLVDTAEYAPSDAAECNSSFFQSMAVSAIESGGKSSNRKVGQNFYHFLGK